MPRFIPATGPKSASIAFIGEAPGAEEARTGIPFVGAAGNMFNSLLQNAGLRREDIYITNVVKQRPPANNIKHYIDLSKKIPVETPEYKAFVLLLKKELEGIDANVFVPLGNVSLYALTGIHPGKITSRRGSLLECTLVPDRKVIPSIHPAAALRNYLYGNFILADFRRIVKESAYREIKLPQPDLIIEPSFLQVMEYLEICKQQEMVAFDIEGVFDFSCISFSHTSSSAICIPFTTQSNQHYFDRSQEAEIWQSIGEICENPKISKLNQNMPYDATAIHYQQGIITNPIEDTMLAQCILFPDYPRDLGFITRMWTKYNYYKDEGIEWIKSGIIKGADIHQLWHYNAMDSIIPMTAFPPQKRMLKLTKNWEAYKVGRDLIQPCMFMQAKGIRVDVEGMKIKDGELEQAKADKLSLVHQIAGFPLNPNSPKQMIEYLYKTKKYPKQYKDGKLSANKRALQSLVAKNCEEAAHILLIRKMKKQQDYLQMELDNGRLTCSFNVAKARSSRLSSSKLLFKFGGNLQTLPKKTAFGDPKPFRKFLLADKGMVFCKIDLSMAENRIVAYIAPDLNMIEIFEAGGDLHINTGGLIDEIPIEEVTKKCRDNTGKTANHSCNYLVGPKGLADAYNENNYNYETNSYDAFMTIKRAKYIIKKYRDIYPGIPHYHSWIMAQARDNRTLVNLFGRHQTFRDRLTSSEAGKGATIFYWIPQSTVSDIINRHGILYIYNDQKTFKDIELLLQVHDEIDFQYPLDMPIEEQFSMLNKIKVSLEQPLYWKGQEFVIPADFEFGFNMWDTEEIKNTEWNFNNFKNLIEGLRK